MVSNKAIIGCQSNETKEEVRVDLILKGGPAEGEVHRNVVDSCVIFRRFAKSPDARYKDSGANNASGLCIFDHTPLRRGEPEQQEGVCDA